jgi:hypothetical protein
LFLWTVLRVYSWIFQAVLCLMAIAVSLATYVTGTGDLMIPWIAFQGPNQAPWLIGVGLVGLLCVWLAITGKLRILLFLFAIHTLYMLVKGFFLSASYSFAGPDEFRNAVILAVGAFIAVVGAWPVGPPKRR